MASCPLPNHCLVCQGMTSTESLRDAVVSGRRAAQAGTEEFRRATDSRDCRTTMTSFPHSMGFPHPPGKQGEPVQRTSLGLNIRRSTGPSVVGRLAILGLIVLLRVDRPSPFGVVVFVRAGEFSICSSVGLVCTAVFLRVGQSLVPSVVVLLGVYRSSSRLVVGF
jgi:hypothetical protein